LPLPAQCLPLTLAHAPAGHATLARDCSRAIRSGADRAAATSSLPLGFPQHLGNTGDVQTLTCAAKVC